MVAYLSYSSVSKYKQCQVQWKYRYVDGIKTQATGKLLAGSAYHEAIAMGFMVKRLYNELPPIESMHSTFINFWNKQVGNTMLIARDSGGNQFIQVPAVKFDNDDPVQLKADAMALMDMYYNDYMTKIQPVIVEEKFTTDYNGIPLLGYIDLIDQNGVVYDHKLQWRSWQNGRVDTDIQPTFYGLLLGRNIEFRFHFAKALKISQLEEAVTARTDDDYAKLGADITAMWQQIQTGVYLRTGSGWVCSQKYCGYWDRCHNEPVPGVNPEVPEEF